MDCKFEAVPFHVGQTINGEAVELVGPGWKATNFIFIPIFHFPEGNGLPDWAEYFLKGRDQFTHPPAASKRYFLCKYIFSFILSFQFESYSFGIVLQSNQLCFFIDIHIFACLEVLYHTGHVILGFDNACFLVQEDRFISIDPGSGRV